MWEQLRVRRRQFHYRCERTAIVNLSFFTKLCDIFARGIGRSSQKALASKAVLEKMIPVPQFVTAMET